MKRLVALFLVAIGLMRILVYASLNAENTSSDSTSSSLSNKSEKK